MASATLPRRAVLSGALSLPIIAATASLAQLVPAPAVARRGSGAWIIPPMPKAWLELRDEISAAHPNGAAAVRRAYLTGMRLGEFRGVQLAARNIAPAELPVLVFGKWHEPGAVGWLVSPQRSLKYTALA